MDELIPKMARDLNILTQENPRKVKLNSIARISSLISNANNAIFDDSARELVKVLNYCLQDPVEGLRESAANLLLEIALKSGKDSILQFLSLLIPTLVQRLGNKKVVVESSEEIRLLLLKLLHQLISKTESDFNNYVESVVEILKVVLLDSYQGVKKEACGIVETLSVSNSKVLGMFGNSIVEAVLPCLGHRHSAVRIMGLQALKAAMIVNVEGLDIAIDHLWPLTLDNTGSVREKLYTVVGQWLLELPDRYSIGYKILPLLFAGLQDEMPGLREKSSFYLNEAGKLYEVEWESRVKDEMDYSDGRDLDIDRPRVGCRHLARDNTLKIVEKMVQGLGDWTPEKRSKSAQILTSFVDYTEDKISGYTANILNSLYKIMAGDENYVINNCANLCKNLGRFVAPDIYIDLIIPQIQTGGGGAIQFLIGSLKVLENLLKGSTKVQSLTVDHIAKVVDMICLNDIISNENIFFRTEISNVLNSILGIQTGVLHPEQQVSYSIFYILVHLKSTEGDATVVGYNELLEQVQLNFSLLLKHLAVDNVPSLTTIYFDRMIMEFKGSVSSWTKHSPEQRLFSTIAVQSGPFVGERLEMFISLCAELAKPDVEFEMKSRLFALLNKLMETSSETLNSKNEINLWTDQILNNIIINNLVWKAGKKAMLIRSFVTELFLRFLSCESVGTNLIGCMDKPVLMSHLDKCILPNIISNLDEDIQKARHEDLVILDILLSNLNFEAPQIKILYPELLKRLDDSQDDIRIQALKTFVTFFNATGRWQSSVKHLLESANEATTIKDDTQECGFREIKLDSVHWETMLKGIAIHLDDMNYKIQEDCCEAFLAAAKVAPSGLLHEILNLCRTKHRSTKYIDVILAALP